MTNFDLLRYIGGVDDQFIMDARKRPKRKPLWHKAVAAVLCLAILTVGGIRFLRQNIAPAGQERLEQNPANGGNLSGDNTLETDYPQETSQADSITAYDVTLLASAQYPESIAMDDDDAAYANWTENQVSQDTAYAQNAFSYKTAAALLQGREGNDCYSPLSLYHTLSILASGAQGTTRDQILNLLGISDLDTLTAENGKLYRVNYTDNDVDVLKIANSLWLDDSTTQGGTTEYHLDWVQSVASNYYADVYSADFSSSDTSAAMGSWIAEKTGGMLHPELSFSADTVMAVVNTLWYKTQWYTPFSSSNTYEDTFTTCAGDAISCDFMHKIEISGSCVQGDGYLKGTLALNQGQMIFVLPEEGQNIEDFLTVEKLWEVFENGSYESAEIHWSIPKFETEVTYSLSDALKQLGVTDAFDLTTADFTSIGTGSDPLYLGSVQQGTHISINEDGVEAATYTMAALAEGASAPDENPLVIEMNLNRPFLYLITANDGSILFLGVVRGQ